MRRRRLFAVSLRRLSSSRKSGRLIICRASSIALPRPFLMHAQCVYAAAPVSLLPAWPKMGGGGNTRCVVPSSGLSPLHLPPRASSCRCSFSAFVPVESQRRCFRAIVFFLSLFLPLVFLATRVLLRCAEHKRSFSRCDALSSLLPRLV